MRRVAAPFELQSGSKGKGQRGISKHFLIMLAQQIVHHRVSGGMPIDRGSSRSIQCSDTPGRDSDSATAGSCRHWHPSGMCCRLDDRQTFRSSAHTSADAHTSPRRIRCAEHGGMDAVQRAASTRQSACWDTSDCMKETNCRWKTTSAHSHSAPCSRRARTGCSVTRYSALLSTPCARKSAN